MISFLKEWFWDVDEPPDRIGAPGLVIMGLFSVFCAVAWFLHAPVKTPSDCRKDASPKECSEGRRSER